jgi:hypothetical protein
MARKWQAGSAFLCVVLCVVVGVGLVVGNPTAAWADVAEAEALIRQGVELRQQGKDERALPLFLKAFEMSPTPRSAGQLGLAEMAVGYWLNAEQHLAIALESPSHPWVAKNKTNLDQSLAQVRGNIGELTIDGAPVGAEVTVDRRPAGTLPLTAPIRVIKGKVDVELNAPGYATARRSVTVTGPQRLTINLDKAAVAPSAVATTTPPPAVPPIDSSPAASTAVVASAPAPTGEGSGSLRRQLGWGAAIAAGAGLVASAVVTVVWQKRRLDFNGRNDCFEDALPERGGHGCSDLYDGSQSARNLAVIGYAVTGALGIGAAVLLLTGNAAEPSSAHVTCAPGWGPSLIGCRLTF